MITRALGYAIVGRLASIRFDWFLRDTPPTHQVQDQHHHSDYQQQVNQTPGHVEAETKKPKNQKHNENCPKHIDLLRSL